MVGDGNKMEPLKFLMKMKEKRGHVRRFITKQYSLTRA